MRNSRSPLPCRLRSARIAALRVLGETKISQFVRATRFCRRIFRAEKRKTAARLTPCKIERKAARIKAACETMTGFESCHTNALFYNAPHFFSLFDGHAPHFIEATVARGGGCEIYHIRMWTDNAQFQCVFTCGYVFG